MANSKLAVSFNAKPLDRQLDKITQKELNTSLNQKIDESYAHTFDEVKHVTNKERERWNNMLQQLKPASADEAGLFSVKDKLKLDGIEERAIRYVHPASGVKPGNYTRVNVNEAGHVVYGDNPARLDITVSDSERLGGFTPSEFAKVNSPTFTGTVKVPEVTISSNPKSPVTIELLQEYVQAQLNKAWPIGSIYMTMSNQNPADLIGGTWKQISQGRFIMGAGTADNKTIPSREMGGNSSITLNETNIPAHKHHITAEIDLSQTGMIGDHYHGLGYNGNNDGYFYSTDRKIRETTGRNINNNQVTGWNGRGDGGGIYKISDGYNIITSAVVPLSNSIEFTEKQKIKIDKDTTEIGGGAGFNITNPYLAAYIWERIG